MMSLIVGVESAGDESATCHVVLRCISANKFGARIRVQLGVQFRVQLGVQSRVRVAAVLACRLYFRAGCGPHSKPTAVAMARRLLQRAVWGPHLGAFVVGLLPPGAEIGTQTDTSACHQAVSCNLALFFVLNDNCFSN